LEVVSPLEEGATVALQLLRKEERRLAGQKGLEHPNDLRTGIPNPFKECVRKEVKDTSALLTTVLQDRRPIPHMWGLVAWQRVAVRALEALRMQLGQEPLVAPIFVQQFPQRKTERGGHGMPP
jgi:hypothetical protein